MPPVWVLFVVVCLFWLFYLVRPFFLPTPRSADEVRRRLVEDKRGYLYALRDAESDFQGGKLSEADYVSIRSRLEERAAAAMRALDELEGGSPERKIEAMLDRLRRQGD